jgi:hypothetical protein
MVTCAGEVNKLHPVLSPALSWKLRRFEVDRRSRRGATIDNADGVSEAVGVETRRATTRLTAGVISTRAG